MRSVTLLLLLLLPGARSVAQESTDSLAPPTVHVPAACAGTPATRCPLVVFPPVPAPIARSASAAQAMIEWQRALADRYGAILLVSDATTLPMNGDTLLQQVLRTYAVDPDKIALAAYGVYYGQCVDFTVFRQVALLSPADFSFGPYSRPKYSPPDCPTGAARPRAARIYLDGALGSTVFIPQMTLRAPQLRQQGHVPELVLALRGYAIGPAEFERMWRWFSEGWAVASATPVPRMARAPGDTAAGPLLSAGALAQLTTFWTRFMQEPDSIRTTARLAHQRHIAVPVQPAKTFQDPQPTQPERFALRMMDTPAMAAQYPSVRAALQAAGLTAQEADAYRQALIVAAANRTPLTPWPMAPSLVLPAAHSRLGQNLAFMQAPEHMEALKALGATGMWVTP